MLRTFDCTKNISNSGNNSCNKLSKLSDYQADQ